MQYNQTPGPTYGTTAGVPQQLPKVTASGDLIAQLAQRGQKFKQI